MTLTKVDAPWEVVRLIAEIFLESPPTIRTMRCARLEGYRGVVTIVTRGLIFLFSAAVYSSYVSVTAKPLASALNCLNFAAFSGHRTCPMIWVS